MAIKDFDAVFAHIGGFGLYQLVLLFLFSYVCLLIPWVHVGQLFMALTPPHWCQPPPELEGLNLTQEEVKLLTIPIDPETNTFAKCSRYDVDVDMILKNDTTLTSDISWNITSCTYGWTYDYTIYYPSITSQFDWVCDEDWKPTFAQSLFFIGSIVSVPIFGWAADKWGRLPVIVATNLLGGVAGIASSFANSFVAFSALRFIVGLSFDAPYVVCYILVLEYVPTDYRTIMGNVPITVFLTMGLCTMPWIAYFLRDWSLFGICIHAPQLLCIFFIWTLPESARWLLGKGRLEDTMKIIQKAAKINKKTLSSTFVQEFEEYGKKVAEETQATASILDLLKTPVLRRRFLLLCVMWMTTSLAFDGFLRNAEYIDFNIFVTYTALGLVELPADIITIISIEKLGRRHTCVFSLILSGVVGASIAAVPPTENTTIFALAVSARFLITMSMNVGLQYVVEVLPTVARSSGAGAIHTLGFVSTFLSPYVVYQARYGYYIPYVILGLVAVTGGISSIFLPETKNEKLPDSLEDGENYFTYQGCCYNPCPRRKKLKVTSI